MENFFNNFSFFLLLCSMSFYWVRAFFNVSIFSNLGKLTIVSANLTMFFLLIYRGISENHFPLSNHAIKKSIIPFLKNFRFSERSKNKIEFHYFLNHKKFEGSRSSSRFPLRLCLKRSGRACRLPEGNFISNSICFECF